MSSLCPSARRRRWLGSRPGRRQACCDGDTRRGSRVVYEKARWVAGAARRPGLGAFPTPGRVPAARDEPTGGEWARQPGSAIHACPRHSSAMGAKTRDDFREDRDAEVRVLRLRQPRTRVGRQARPRGRQERWTALRTLSRSAPVASTRSKTPDHAHRPRDRPAQPPHRPDIRPRAAQPRRPTPARPVRRRTRTVPSTALPPCLLPSPATRCP